MKRCDGALVLALGHLRVQILGTANESTSQAIGGVSLLPTVYNHLEGALAFAARIPLFILIEQGMDRTGIFASGTKPVFIPSNADERWPDFKSFKDTSLPGRRNFACGETYFSATAVKQVKALRSCEIISKPRASVLSTGHETSSQPEQQFWRRLKKARAVVALQSSFLLKMMKCVETPPGRLRSTPFHETTFCWKPDISLKLAAKSSLLSFVKRAQRCLQISVELSTYRCRTRGTCRP